MVTRCAVLLGLVAATRGEMESFVVGGGDASIIHYPHSAFLSVLCVSAAKKRSLWSCGSSILNQQILLTAAHCLHPCQDGTHVAISIGDATRMKGISNSAYSFLIHEEYNEMNSHNDIGLVRMKTPVKLNATVSRVALLINPPYTEPASVAGWGLIDEIWSVTSKKLKFIDQIVQGRDDCMKRIGKIPFGTICASNKDETQYPSKGDSGSALVVRGFIQIGLVSFKKPSVAREVIVYTDTSYFYDWIKFNSQRLNCIDKL